jgi:hypothetical protein
LNHSWSLWLILNKTSKHTCQFNDERDLMLEYNQFP